MPRSIRFIPPTLLLLAWLFVRGVAQAQGTTLNVATEPAFPPFEAQSATGELEGFDIDLMRAIGAAAGFQVQFKSLPFDGIIPALQAGTVDAAISTITITPERAKTVSFSEPYFNAGLAIAVRAENTGITSLDALQGKTIAVQIGTTGAAKARSVPKAKVRTFDAAPLALQELLNGNVDAVINDAPVTLYAIKSRDLKGLRVVSRLLTEERYGIALPQNSPNLESINRGLEIIHQNGVYDQLYQKWFATEPPKISATGTLDIILAGLPVLLYGAVVTIQLTAISVLFGMVAGSLIGIARLSPTTPISLAARVYIDFFRGTPLLVQIFMIYFGLPALIKSFGLTFTFDQWVAAVLALSLNSAAYIAEIVRGGIQSIDPGQWEAAQSLGMGPVPTMRYVIFPQAFRRMIPPLGNEFITLLKDTSLVAVIGFTELFRQGQLIVAQNYRAFEIYAAVALLYLVLTLLSSQAFSFLERWMNPVRKTSPSPVPPEPVRQ
ncbi:ABC transporter permease subunit [Anthocerotibacter panamensis]|uniref:ABC transporter permease subunit n=1 Tax=Anthocerotibacter panamensis TaxID=2857077 RepID=UPI001C404FA5|nr:ABC transporter permease subunit [Anthocerotibacter panamensis]